MASTSLHLNHTFPYLLQSQTPKPILSKTLSIFPNSSHSQFHGIRLRKASKISLPSTSRAKTSIVCKVIEGTAAPSFRLINQDGKKVSLWTLQGKPVIVYFYIADETPDCVKQACAFRDSYEKFKEAGAEVIGISVDNAASHKAFAEKYKLPFTLLADEGNYVRQEWGVPSYLFGALPGRQTYVLDKNGVCRFVYNNQLQPEKHIEETLKFLKSSETD